MDYCFVITAFDVFSMTLSVASTQSCPFTLFSVCMLLWSFTCQHWMITCTTIFSSWDHDDVFIDYSTMCIWCQGSVLSAFFWGYATTQVIGGYLSDRFGAELVMAYAIIGWSCLTLVTPIITRSFLIWSHESRIHMFIILRILTGCVQGMTVWVSEFCLCLLPYWLFLLINYYLWTIPLLAWYILRICWLQ